MKMAGKETITPLFPAISSPGGRGPKDLARQDHRPLKSGGQPRARGRQNPNRRTLRCIVPGCGNSLFPSRARLLVCDERERERAETPIVGERAHFFPALLGPSEKGAKKAARKILRPPFPSPRVERGGGRDPAREPKKAPQRAVGKKPPLASLARRNECVPFPRPSFTLSEQRERRARRPSPSQLLVPEPAAVARGRAATVSLLQSATVFAPFPSTTAAEHVSRVAREPARAPHRG